VAGRNQSRSGVSLANVVFVASLLVLVLVEAKGASFANTKSLCPISFTGKVVGIDDTVSPEADSISKVQITFQVAPSNETKQISVAKGSIDELALGDKVSVSMRDQWLCSLQKL